MFNWVAAKVLSAILILTGLAGVITKYFVDVLKVSKVCRDALDLLIDLVQTVKASGGTLAPADVARFEAEIAAIVADLNTTALFKYKTIGQRNAEKAKRLK